MIAIIFLCTQLVFAAEISGLWTSDYGHKIIVPFIRDGDIPVLFASASGPLIPLWSRWSVQKSSLVFTDKNGSNWTATEGNKEHTLSLTKGEKNILLERKANIIQSEASGIWHGVSGDEFIPFVLSNKIYVIHRNKMQITRVYLGKWKKNKEGLVYEFNAKKKCTVELQSNQPNIVQTKCGRSSEPWERYYQHIPLEAIDINGYWRAGDLILKIELDGLRWVEAYIEHDRSITEYRAEWAGGLDGKKFYLRHPDKKPIIGNILNDEQDVIQINLNDTEVNFYKIER